MCPFLSHFSARFFTLISSTFKQGSILIFLLKLYSKTIHSVKPQILIKQLSSSIFEIEEMGFVSSFLINGSKKSILIDSGFGILNYSEVLKDIATHEIEVANTHIHPDHSNGNGYFTQTLMSETEWENHGLKWNKATENIKNGKWNPSSMFSYSEMEDHLPADFNAATYNAFIAKGLPIPTRFVKNGDFIDLGDRQLEIIATPAHTTGSISFLDSESVFLFGGDAFARSGLWLLNLKCRASLEELFKTYERLNSISKKIKGVFPAHGKKNLPHSFLQEIHQKMNEIRDGSLEGVFKKHKTGDSVFFDFGGFGPMFHVDDVKNAGFNFVKP